MSSPTTGPPAGAPAGAVPLRAVHHVGVTVADLERSVEFWARLVGTPPRARNVLDGPRVGELVGYPGVRIDRCWLDLPGGVALELLHYRDHTDAPYDPGTAHPGNVHVCLLVDDMGAAHAHAVSCGARPVSAAPVEVAAGPNAGARVAYLRDPDGVTIELFQPPPVSAP